MNLYINLVYELETNRYLFSDTDTTIFKILFTNIWLVVDI